VIDVMTALSADRGETTMTFTINEQNEIVAYAMPEEAAAHCTTPFDTFSSQDELAGLAASWPDERIAALWNSLPGVTPMKKFKDAKTAVSRIWMRIQGLGQSTDPAERPTEATAEKKAKGGARGAKGAREGKSNPEGVPCQDCLQSQENR
jgi:hypothetical protein